MPTAEPARGPQPSRLVAKIEAALRELSPNDHRIAEHLLSAYPDAAWQTVEEIARQAGVSKAAVVRFAARLGYEGFADLQRQYQSELTARLASPLTLLEERDPSASRGALIDEMLDKSIENLRRTRQRLSERDVEKVTRRLASVRGSVYVLGVRKSAGPATYLAQLLGMVRPNVHLVDAAETAYPEVFQDVGPHDILVAITVRRYARATMRAMDHCRSAGVFIVAITDALAGPATPRSDVVFVGSADGVSLFDSAIGVLFVIEGLVNGVVVRSRARAAARLAHAEDVASGLGLFEQIRPPSHRATSGG